MKIRFRDGYYETSDKEEIRALQRDDHVVEVPDEPLKFETGGIAVADVEDADFDAVEPRDGEPGSTITRIP